MGVLVNSFNSNPRRIQELAGRTPAEAIYRSVFGPDIQVERFDDTASEKHLLDREHAIDARLRLPSGMMLTLQEKFLSNAFARFASLTVEYEQNQHTHEPGDWYKLASQLYFTGYLSENNSRFVSWALVNWAQLVIASEAGLIEWRMNANKDGRARASFKYVRFDEIPESCVIARSR